MRKAANFHESTTVEIAWTIVPFIIIILMALPATRVIVAMKDTSAADLTIKATGIQWKWGYDYLNGEGEGIGFLSTLDPTHREMSDSGKPSGDDYLFRVDNPLVVPVDRKIRIITTANDVIHAWGVPSLGVKQDAMPGFVRDTWFRASVKATTTASASSSAARSTRTCRSTSRSSPSRLTRPGSTATQGGSGQGRRSRQGLGTRAAGRPR